MASSRQERARHTQDPDQAPGPSSSDSSLLGQGHSPTLAPRPGHPSSGGLFPPLPSLATVSAPAPLPYHPPRLILCNQAPAQLQSLNGRAFGSTLFSAFLQWPSSLATLHVSKCLLLWLASLPASAPHLNGIFLHFTDIKEGQESQAPAQPLACGLGPPAPSPSARPSPSSFPWVQPFASSLL